MHMQRCGNCFWAQDRKGALICVANPPSVYPISRPGKLAGQMEQGALSMYPAVDSDQKGCRFWQSAPWGGEMSSQAEAVANG